MLWGAKAVTPSPLLKKKLSLPRPGSRRFLCTRHGERERLGPYRYTKKKTTTEE